jgi:hypothetical protein
MVKMTIDTSMCGGGGRGGAQEVEPAEDFLQQPCQPTTSDARKGRGPFLSSPTTVLSDQATTTRGKLWWLVIPCIALQYSCDT